MNVSPESIFTAFPVQVQPGPVEPDPHSAEVPLCAVAHVIEPPLKATDQSTRTDEGHVGILSRDGLDAEPHDAIKLATPASVPIPSHGSSVPADPSDYYCMPCPHCQEVVMLPVKELNCKIFRHGVKKSDFTPMDPHTPQAECERLVQADEIYGCGKPFRFVDAHDTVPATLETCGYI